MTELGKNIMKVVAIRPIAVVEIPGEIDLSVRVNSFGD